MVLLRSMQWPAVVVKEEDTVVTVKVFGKGAEAKTVKKKDVFPFPPPAAMHLKKPKVWKTAMAEAEKWLNE